MNSSNESEKKMDCYNFLLLYIKNKYYEDNKEVLRNEARDKYRKLL